MAACSLKPTGYAEEVADGQEALVEEHEDPEEEEEDAKAAEADPQLLLVRDLHVCNYIHGNGQQGAILAPTTV